MALQPIKNYDVISQNGSQPIVISFRTFSSWTRNTFRAVQLLIWLRSLYKLSILSKVYQLLSLALLVYLCTESDRVNCDALWVWVLFISPSFKSEKQKIKKVVSTKITGIYRFKYFSVFESKSLMTKKISQIFHEYFWIPLKH